MKSVLREKYRLQASRRVQKCQPRLNRFHIIETEDIYDQVCLKLQSMNRIEQWAVTRIVLDNIVSLIVYIETTAVLCRYRLAIEFQLGRRVQLTNTELPQFLIHYFFQSQNPIDKKFIDSHTIGYYQILREISNVEYLSNFKNIKKFILGSLESEYDKLCSQLKKMSIENCLLGDQSVDQDSQIDENQKSQDNIQQQIVNGDRKKDISERQLDQNAYDEVDKLIDDDFEQSDLSESADQVVKQDIPIGETSQQNELIIDDLPLESYLIPPVDIHIDTYEDDIIEILNNFKLFFLDPKKAQSKKDQIYQQLMQIDAQLDQPKHKQDDDISITDIRNQMIMIQTLILQTPNSTDQKDLITYYEQIFNEALLIAQSESS